MIKLYTMQENSDSKIIICDVSAYNAHPDFRPDFRRKKCVLYTENYGNIDPGFFLCFCADLSKNRLLEIPPEVCDFPNLERLNLYNNVIKSLPQALVQLQSLVHLNIR